MNNFQGEKKMKQEQTHFKMTLLWVKDWDGFQVAMGRIMMHSDRRSN